MVNSDRLPAVRERATTIDEQARDEMTLYCYSHMTRQARLGLPVHEDPTGGGQLLSR